MKVEIVLGTTLKNKKRFVTLLGKEGPLGNLKLPESITPLYQNLVRQAQEGNWKADLEKWGSIEAEYIVYPYKSHPGLNPLDSLRLSAYNMGKSLKSHQKNDWVLSLDLANSLQISAILDGLNFAHYAFTTYKSKPDKQSEVTYTCLVAQKSLHATQKAWSRAQIMHQYINEMRDLINTPGSDLIPEVFAATAQKRSRSLGITCKIRTPSELLKEGFNGLISVGKGSKHGPRMVTLEYKPKGKNPHISLVGKGVTFDTGGISLKPGNDMWEMKGDMAGAATVLGATLAIAKLKLPIHIRTVLVLAENSPGPGAILPGDIFKARNGKTIMVENTDAEGRLILSDGLYEAQLSKPLAVVDLATLTGSIVRALGSSMAGLFTNNTSLSNLICDSGTDSGEKYWRMPLDREYRSAIDDSVADMKNIGKAEAGSITASLFLEHFVNPGQTWAHLDIAGPAFLPGSWKYFGIGGTAWGLSTLVEMAERLSQGHKLSNPDLE